MSDLIPQLARNTFVRATERPIVTPALEKAAEQALASAARPAVAPEVARRAARLLDTNVAVVLPSETSQLIGLARAGSLETGLTLSLGNVSQEVAQKGGVAAMVLTDQAKEALAAVRQSAGLDAALEKLAEANFTNSGLRFGAETSLPASLDLGRSVQHVLIDAPEHPEFLRQYGEAVARGEAPAAIGGKPFVDFFRASDDLYNDLEIEAFQRAVPGFARRSLDEQRAVASLAGRVAADFPSDVPEATRRRVASTMVSYVPVEGSSAGTQAVADLKAFYKGVQGGKGIADSIAQDGLRAGSEGRYGAGVYHTPSPTAASGYTYRNTVTPAELVSGEVDPGRAVAGRHADFDQNAAADTRWVRRADLDQADYGDYGVTKDPARFTIRAITRYRPDEATGLESVLPDLLEAHRQAPSWTAKLLDRIEPERRKRAFAYALQNGSPEARQSAAFLLARTGDARGVQLTVDALRQATDTRTTNAAGAALRGAIPHLGERTPEASAVLQALSGSPYLEGKESTIAKEVEASLGTPGIELLKLHGWKQVRGPRPYWSR